jgi:excisionase family DNA binding protein
MPQRSRRTLAAMPHTRSVGPDAPEPSEPVLYGTDIQKATLSIVEAAQRVGLSVKATRNAAKSGEIPAIRIGRRLLVLREPLEAMLRLSQPSKKKA